MRPAMKTIADALEVRGEDLRCVRAGRAGGGSGCASAAWLTFVVVGAGPTGVEMAGQIAELSRYSLPVELPEDRPRSRAEKSCWSIEGAQDPVELRRANLPSGPRRSSNRMRGRDPGRGRRSPEWTTLKSNWPPRTAVRAACREDEDLVGGRASVAARRRPRQTGRCRANPVRAGLPERADCTVQGHPEVFVIGDLMALDDLPGLGGGGDPVGASHRPPRSGAAWTVTPRPGPSDTATSAALAAVSRYYAVGQRRNADVWGVFGWLVWLVVHLTFLTGFKNRTSALFHWTISFFGRSRPERTITAQQIFARQALATSRPQRVAEPATVSPGTTPRSAGGLSTGVRSRRQGRPELSFTSCMSQREGPIFDWRHWR